MLKRLIFGLAALLIFLGAVEESNAGPIDVSYTVSGSSGDYFLDFSVTNNMLSWPTQNVYFFAVRVSVTDAPGSPAPYLSNTMAGYNPAVHGGTAVDLNNTWVDTGLSGALLPGTTLSGFIVHIPDLVAPTAVSWAAISFGTLADSYTGGGNYLTPQNPGFQGIASVPEPSTLILSAILLGISGTGGVCKRLKQSAV